MLTEKMTEAVKKYPELGDILELAAHHDENTPIHRLCVYIATLTADIMDNVPEVTQVSDDDESE